MNHSQEIKALTRLTDAHFAAEQARMAALRQIEEAIRAKLAALDRARAARATSLTEADPALQAGADMLWQTWIENRRAALNGELARNRVGQEVARAALGLAFGRNQATLGLVRRLAQDRAKARARRDDLAS